MLHARNIHVIVWFVCRYRDLYLSVMYLVTLLLNSSYCGFFFLIFVLCNMVLVSIFSFLFMGALFIPWEKKKCLGFFH